MRRLLHRTLIACAALTFATSIAAAAPNTGKSGPVQQNGGPVSQKASVPPLSLSDGQRKQIQQALAAEHTAVSFGLKSAKSAQAFEPAVHAKLPKALRPHPFPRPLIYALPVLKHYDYVKFKSDVLIVNPLNREIVDVLPTGNG